MKGCNLSQSALLSAILDRNILARRRNRFALGMKSFEIVGGELLRNSITGNAGCCGRAASGDATVAPSAVMKLRRFKRTPKHQRSTLPIPHTYGGARKSSRTTDLPIPIVVLHSVIRCRFRDSFRSNFPF